MKNFCQGDEGIVEEQARQAVRKNLELFDQSMEPGYLDRAMKELEKLVDRDDRGVPVQEIRRYRLEAYFKIFRVATESIDPVYLPKMVRLFKKHRKGKTQEKDSPEPRPIPPKVASAYLYDYLQSGLRVFRFQTRLAILDYIRSAYHGIPSPEEQQELLSLAEGVEEEFLSLLKEFIRTDVSWRPGGKGRSAGARDGKGELEELTSYLRHIKVLKRSRDPLYLPDDHGCMNIAPPLLPGQDSMIISGQAPDSVKNPEARRQYLIARKENARKSMGMSLEQKIEEDLRETQRGFFGKLESSKLLDAQSGSLILKTAREQGMDERFLDNLREELAIREIRAAMARFEKTKAGDDLDAACLLVEQFRRCGEEVPGRWGASSSFQLERWLELHHLISKEPAFENNRQIRRHLEERMMETIWRTCAGSCSSLREAGWWLRAYGMDKRMIEQVTEECRRLVEVQEQGIRGLLLAVEQNCMPDKVKQANRAIYRLTHHNYESHKDIPDILDFKLRSWLHLMGIVERNLDPDHDHYSECSMVFKKTGMAQKAAAPEVQKRLFSHHRDILHTVESLVNDNYDDTREIQQRALRLLEEMKVKPEWLNSFRHHFDTCNLRKSIQQLCDKGKGEPEQILKAIRTWANDEEEDPEWPYRSFINKISRQVDLLEAMWKSGNLGPEGFAQSFQEQIMADIQQTLPDDREGRSAMEEIFRRAGESPLKDAVGEILKNRISAKRAFFSEQVARFEETGDLKSLDVAFNILDYLIYAEHQDEERQGVRREKTDAYLSLLRAMDLFSPEELVGRQKTPASHWGRGWNEQLAPLDRMKLLLKNRRDWVRSSFFSHVRYQYGASPEEMEEVRQLVRNYGMDDEFRKEVEERLSGKE